MKKFLKVLGITLFVFIVALIVMFFVSDEDLPQGTSGEEADKLAQKMVSAMNKDAFDAVEVLEWSFRGKNYYTWKKQEGLVNVSWEDTKITLNLNDISKSTGGSGEDIQKALANFNNDSFLLIESIPSRETRIFVERVLTNLVIYELINHNSFNYADELIESNTIIIKND